MRMPDSGEGERLLASAFHDLRDPLHTAVGYLDVLARQRDRLDEEGRECLAAASASLERIGRLIEQTLAYLRAGHTDVQLAPVALRDAVKRAWASVEGLARQARWKLEAGDLPLVWADAGALERILQNLLSNALNNRSSRPPVVTVSAVPMAGGWRVDVADNGVGIDQAGLAQLFRPFVRLRGHSGGTGLGLATCKQMAEALGGRIWADSQLDVGSVFHVWLPALPRARLKPASPPKPTAPSLHGRRSQPPMMGR